jgi:AcrR family transcriptional regulator
MSEETTGRRQQAARNDTVILEAAREVFLADPGAPVSAVATRAQVGMGALYRRHGSKEELLRRLCADGLHAYVRFAETAADADDPWRGLAEFLRNVVDADVHSLTVRLAGTFTPTPEMTAEAVRAGALTAGLFERAADRLRPDAVVEDLQLVLEGCAAVRGPDADRTRELRRRYLALQLDGLSASGADPLPGPPPTGADTAHRWHR